MRWRPAQYASKSTLASAVFEKRVQGGRVFAEAAAKTAKEFGSQGLQDEPVFFFDEGNLRALANIVFPAEARRDDQLTFGGDGG
jgi:hypothetical protein